MQNYFKTIGALITASALSAGNASAELEFEIHSGYSSQYVFRGVDVGDDLIEFGLDTSYTNGAYTASGGVWGAYFTGASTSNQIDSEFDFYAESAYDFGYVTGAVGYIYFWNVGRLGSDAQEVYFSLSKEFYGFNTSLAYFYDVAGSGIENDGYTEFHVSKGHDITSCLTLNNGLTLGYLVEQGTATHIQLRTSLDWRFSENATISPFTQFSVSLTEEGANNTGAGNEFIAGSSIAVSF